jgi:hypothetical protein
MLVDLGAVERRAPPVDRRIVPSVTHHGEHCDFGKPVPIRDPLFLGAHIACRPVMFSSMRRGAETVDDGRGCV